MSSQHIFKSELNWKSNLDNNTQGTTRLSRRHKIEIEGKQILELSAAKAFKGDADLHNPEDMLLSALTSCHMMSYLYVCSQHNIEVLAYSDNSEGKLEVEGTGKGRFSRVDLNPVVTIKNERNLELAKELHTKANELCFIANSCNFPIHHHAKIGVR